MGKQQVIQEQPTLYFPAGGQPAADLHFSAQATRPRRARRGVWLLVLFVLMLLTAVTGVATLFYASPLLLPGTQVMGVNVGGLSVNDTAVTLSNQWQQAGLTLESETATWPVSPSAMGIELDAWATAERAHADGRSPDGLWEWITTGRLAVTPVYTLDTAVAATYLESLAPQWERAPVNATVHVSNGQAQATPAANGQSLNVAATVAYLQQYQAAVLAHGRLPLSYTLIPAAITDVTAVLQQLNQLLSRTLILQGYDPISDEMFTWNLPPEVWGNWVAVTIDPENPTLLRWDFDSPPARVYLEEQANKLGDGRYLQMDATLRQLAETIRNGETTVTARVYHHPTSYVVQAGDTLASIGRVVGIPYPWIQQANPGLSGLSPGQMITIPSLDEMLPLPVVPHKRIIVSISQQRVQALENGQLKWDWPASTGIASSPTAPGIFQVQSHEPNAYAANWNLWMPNFLGIYRPVPTSDFMNGFHGFPNRDGYNLLWTNNLGAPVTYGCILISNENAQALYEWAEEGTVVEIRE
ncbi:MAG: L,D-transpeptidase family protein [Chloroflexi bacterium]|nr:L,D-transpeptidase family protein [Ardenticatenaceae bacterium]NOG37509.1 L,D-transpeptidase family protein [Chloroflexota bacterium]